MSATLGALADPTRRAILRALARGPADIAALTRPFRMSQQAVSKHVAVLERARLVKKWRDGRRQVCSLLVGPFDEVAGWIDRHRRMWEERLDRLEDYLREVRRKETLRVRKTQDPRVRAGNRGQPGDRCPP